MKYIIVVLVAVAMMSPVVLAKEKGGGNAGAPKGEKVAAAPSFKGTLAVTKDADQVTAATLTVKDVVYQIKLDDNGLKLAGEAADKDVSVKGAVVTTTGADGKEIKTITVEKFTIVVPKAEHAAGGKGK
jgi:hypothetical protein